jgi:hypothetical protein
MNDALRIVAAEPVIQGVGIADVRVDVARLAMKLDRFRESVEERFERLDAAFAVMSGEVKENSSFCYDISTLNQPPSLKRS